MNPVLQALLNRLKEPSTYAGLGALLALLGVNLPASTLQAIVATLTAVAGLAAILIPEAKPKPPAPPAA